MKSVLERLTIIPVSHVSKDSVIAVRKAFNEIKPDIIAVELCSKRFQALMEIGNRKAGKLEREGKRKKPLFNFYSIKRVGVKGFLFGIIASFIQKKIGKSLDIEPGSEMIEAVNIALKNNKQLALVDQDIEITLKKISINLTLREKFNFLIDLIKGLFGIGAIKFDINKVPDDELINKILEQTKNRYPSLHKVLVEERNGFIARKIFNLLIKNENSKVMAVLGAGHKKEIIQIIGELEKKLLKNQIEFSYSFSI